MHHSTRFIAAPTTTPPHPQITSPTSAPHRLLRPALTHTSIWTLLPAPTTTMHAWRPSKIHARPSFHMVWIRMISEVIEDPNNASFLPSRSFHCKLASDFIDANAAISPVTMIPRRTVDLLANPPLLEPPSARLLASTPPTSLPRHRGTNPDGHLRCPAPSRLVDAARYHISSATDAGQASTTQNSAPLIDSELSTDVHRLSAKPLRAHRDSHHPNLLRLTTSSLQVAIRSPPSATSPAVEPPTRQPREALQLNPSPTTVGSPVHPLDLPVATNPPPQQSLTSPPINHDRHRRSPLTPTPTAALLAPSPEAPPSSPSRLAKTTSSDLRDLENPDRAMAIPAQTRAAAARSDPSISATTEHRRHADCLRPRRRRP